MKYSELVEAGASPTEIQSYLRDSELVSVTIRIPRTHREGRPRGADWGGRPPLGRGLGLLFQVLPTFRIPYSARIEEYEIDGAKCFNVNDGQLIACFDTEVGTSVIEKIAQERPIYAVFRDASLANDSAAANFEELFRTYSLDTIRRVI